MNAMLQKTWTTLDGELIFEISIARALSDGTSSVKIYPWGNTSDFHTVAIFRNHWTNVHFAFKNGCYVRGRLRQIPNVRAGENAQFPEENTVGVAIAGDIHSGHSGRFDEHRFEGIMAVFETGDVEQPHRPAPSPFLPPPESPSAIPRSLTVPCTCMEEEVFPHVYLRKWLETAPEQLQRRFVRFDAGTGPSDRYDFYRDLCAARARGREEMEKLATAFIAGKAPYAGQFVAHPDALSGIVSLAADTSFPVQEKQPGKKIEEREKESYPTEDAEEAAEEKAAAQTQNLSDDIGKHLASRLGTGDRPAIKEKLTAPDYLHEKERVWQSYFALNILPGDDPALLMFLSRTLVNMHLLDYLFVDGPEAPCDPETKTYSFTGLPSNPLPELSHASIVLPGEIFPLPPRIPESGTPDGFTGKNGRGWIEPCAIGELQMVRQRLLGYRPGDIAHIENVMRGEKKKVARRHLHREIDYDRDEAGQEYRLENDSGSARRHLLSGKRQAVAEHTTLHRYDDFQSSYGPPTQATLNGSWSEQTQRGENPGIDDRVRFAHEILNRSAEHIAHKVNHLRSRGALDETGERSARVIDNTTGTHGLVGIFRWLDKVCEARVVNYGNRLLLQFMLLHPAADFIDEQEECGGPFVPPRSPKAYGISSFAAIDPENYPRIAALYDVTALTPPPTRKQVAATLRGDETKLLTLPAGYRAASARVRFGGIVGGSAAPAVMVGNEIFRPDDDAEAVAAEKHARRFGQDVAVPVALIPAPSSSNPSASRFSSSLPLRPSVCLPDGIFAGDSGGYRSQRRNRLRTGRYDAGRMADQDLRSHRAKLPPPPLRLP